MSGTFDGVDAGLVFLGAFYAFAGVVGIRAAVISNFLDAALAQISLTPTPTDERLRFYWLVASSVVIFLGGIALMLRASAALWLFAASAAGQALYLSVLAPRYFDRRDPPDGRGRSQTTNAFYIYLVATALVALAASAGRLKAISALTQTEVAAGLAACVALVVLVARWVRPQRRND